MLDYKIKNIPESPGVYFMKDKYDNVIYVGKSKNLKKRVKSYFVKSESHSNKVIEMVKKISDIDYIITDTEIEALILESRTIKDIKPMYNRLLKNHKKYIYIKITDEDYPNIVTALEKEDNSSMYLGPFSSRGRVEEVIEILKDYYKLRRCNRMKKSPCLNYNLNNCVGACMKDYDKSIYSSKIVKVIDLFQGKNKEILNEFNNLMNECKNELNFEDAAKYKRYLSALKYVLKNNEVIKVTTRRKNYFLYELISEKVGKVFLVSGNEIVFKESIDLNQIEYEEFKEVLIKKILNNFNHKRNLNEVSKISLDEAIIIHSYIKNNKNLKSLSLPKALLIRKDEKQLKKKIDKIFKKLII